MFDVTFVSCQNLPKPTKTNDSFVCNINIFYKGSCAAQGNQFIPFLLHARFHHNNSAVACPIHHVNAPDQKPQRLLYNKPRELMTEKAAAVPTQQQAVAETRRRQAPCCLQRNETAATIIALTLSWDPSCLCLLC